MEIEVSEMERQATKLRWILDFSDFPTEQAQLVQAHLIDMLGTLTQDIEIGEDIGIGGNTESKRDLFSEGNECPKCGSKFIIYDELDDDKVCLCCGLREYGSISYDRFLELHILRWAIQNRPNRDYDPPRDTGILPARVIRDIFAEYRLVTKSPGISGKPHISFRKNRRSSKRKYA